VLRRARQIKVLLMDVDGTLTDGAVTLLSQPDGSALEIKTFDAHDGRDSDRRNYRKGERGLAAAVPRAGHHVRV
jgi:3-deoxy-D-manno-octulosonate 8-phosphate phosphatase KdsC-like HAD superfamily phosphatase